MKYAKLIVALTLTISPLLANAQLTKGEEIVTKVPFGFTIGGKAVPAGSWAVTTNNDQGTILRISNGDAKVNLLSLVSTAETEKFPSGQCGLVFYRYQDHYFLRGVMVEGSRTVYRLPEGTMEKEIRAQNVVSEQVLIAARE